MMKIQTKLRLIYLKNLIKSRFGVEDSKYDRSNRKRVWIFLAADYGNLGDVAITECQTEYLRRRFERDAEVCTVPISETLSAVHQIKRIVGPEDIITIVGGGNISNLYEDIEYLRQLVIQSFPDNKIISFPQSVYFTNSKKGNKEKNNVRKIYGNHRNLILLIRDKVSYERMKSLLPSAKIGLAPDIVMTYNLFKDNVRKKQILVCIRKDKEASKNGDISTLIQTYADHGYSIIEKDTQIDDKIVRNGNGKEQLHDYLDIVKASSLMITNRLHGMIFAYITGTPAIAIDNSTGKIFSTYEWIKDCGFIHLFNDITPTITENILSADITGLRNTNKQINDRFEHVMRTIAGI